MRTTAKRIEKKHFVGIGGCLPRFNLPGPKNRRRGKNEHAGDRRLYHGPIHIDPLVVAEAQSMPVVRTTARKLAISVSRNGVDYVFRKLGGCDYLGEIIETADGQIRVHVWTISRDVNARPVADLVAWHRDGIETN